MFLPKLSDKEIGRYHSKDSANQNPGLSENGFSKTSDVQAQYDAATRKLAELKAQQAKLGQALHRRNVRTRTIVYPGIG